MSRAAERGELRRQQADSGFTLLEVVVALGVMMAVMVALLPQLVVGIKSNGSARFVTQAKGVTQGELERIRNLPYHIAPAAGDFIDVLDHYYPDDSSGGSPTCMSGGSYVQPVAAWAGYVAADNTARCAYEPATGAFYRSIRVVPPSAGSGGFTVLTDTQFLSGATPPLPVSPRAGYDTAAVGKDNPPSSQIGVTVTVFYTDRGTLRPVSTYTQVAARLPATMRVRAESNVTTIQVGSVTSDNVPLSMSAGLVNIAGSLSHASTVSANLAATTAGLATDQQASGASMTAAAPPTVISPATPAGAGELTLEEGCAYACWDSTQLGAVSVTAEQGLPRAGTTLAPLQAMVTGMGANNGFSFGNSATAAGYRPGLGLVAPLVRLDTTALPVPSGLSGCATGAGGVASFVTGSGYLNTTSPDDAAAPSVVESCAVARTTPVSLFPTSFAPQGVVKVELVHASASCLVQSSAHTPTAGYDYHAVVRYWDGSGYVAAATIVPGLTVDPLESLSMTTPVGGGHVLGDYIASWSALTVDKVTRSEADGRAAITLPGVVNIATQPVRADATVPENVDSTSAVSLTVGALGCSAEDTR